MTRRYAHREMLFRGILAPGTPNSYVSGKELLAVVTRVAELTETRPEPQLTDDEITIGDYGANLAQQHKMNIRGGMAPLVGKLLNLF